MSNHHLPVPIDDRPLRQSLFKTAADILKKIEKLENEVLNFREKDQNLFQNWYQLTFKADLERAERLYKEYADLATFHNSVLAQADMHDQTLSEALASLRREQKRYEKGTEAQKKKIEELRLKREEFLKEAMASKDDKLEDEKAFEEVRRRKEAFYFFDDLLHALEQRDGLRILAMWDRATEEMRQDAEESFQELRGVSVTAFIERLRGEKESIDKEIKSPQATYATPSPPADYKTLYRKLARRLHPDVMKATSKVTAAWVQQTWLKVQEAYKNQDAEALQRLDLTTLIRMQELHHLSLDEIRSSAVALNSEFDDLRLSIKDLKKHPAWKFSSKRTFDTLKKKLKAKLDRDLEPLRYDIENLREMYGHRR